MILLCLHVNSAQSTVLCFAAINHLVDFSGNRSLLQRAQNVMSVGYDLWISIFVLLLFSRFVGCRPNYDWWQPQTELNITVSVLLRGAVRKAIVQKNCFETPYILCTRQKVHFPEVITKLCVRGIMRRFLDSGFRHKKSSMTLRPLSHVTFSQVVFST